MKFLSRLPKVCYTCLSLTCIHSLTMQNQSFFKNFYENISIFRCVNSGNYSQCKSM